MPPLRRCLLDTYLVRLQAIATFWEIPLTATSQREIALELAEAMPDPQAIERARALLTEDQHQALRALLAADGIMPQRVFVREWGDMRAMGPGRMERERPWEDPISPAEGLWYRGFLFQSFEQGPDGAYEVLTVPPELRHELPRPEPAQPVITLDAISAPEAVTSAEDLLLDDACTLLAYVQNERPRPAPDNLWPERHRQRLLARLHLQDPERFTFLRHLAVSAGWLVGDETGSLRPVPNTVTAWLQSTSFEQRCRMAESWRDDASWNDLFHVPTLRPEDTGAWRNDPVLARQAVLRHARSCAPTSWYSLQGFTDAIKEADPDFQRPSGDYDTWYIRDRRTGTYLSGFENWDAVEGRLIRYLLTVPMHWLGLVDLAAREDHAAPRAFRLSPAGAAFLDLAEPPSRTPSPPPRVRHGFRVLVPAAHRYERFQLSRVAEWVQTGEPFIYRLTPPSLERARHQGIPVSRLVRFLGQITEGPLPRSLEEALQRWDTRGTEARLQQAVLLRLSGEELMERVMSAPHLARLIEERIGPTAALVREKDWPQIVARLEDIGLLPAVPDEGD